MEVTRKSKEERDNEIDAYRRLRKKRRRNVVLNTIGAILALGGIIWACNFFIRYLRFEITNDATIEQYITPINSRVSGYIKEVRFVEHQWVNEGDTLVLLDDRELRIKLLEAQSILLEVKGSKQANKEANVLRREAEQEMAEFNLSQTIVTAPYSGYLGRRTLAVGQLLQAGQTITTLIKKDNKWVVANYREKQIAGLYIGQGVHIKVDAIQYKVFKGKITAISEATGSKYALLSTDNSAGNFVKVQQRIPVRIDFDDILDEDMKRLRVGMMVVCEAIKE